VSEAGIVGAVLSKDAAVSRAACPGDNGPTWEGGNGRSNVEGGRRYNSVLHACSRAFAKALTLRKRPCGSLARAISTTSSTAGGISGTFSHNEGGGTLLC